MSSMNNAFSIFQCEPFVNKPELLTVDTILIRLGAYTGLDFRLRRTRTKQKPAQGIACILQETLRNKNTS